MMMRHLSIFATLVMLPTAGLGGADLFCGFHTECRGQNTCEETDWSAEMSLQEDGTLVMEEPNGPASRMALLSDKGEVRHYAGVSDVGSPLLMSIAGDGAAVLTMRTFYEEIITLDWYGDCSAGSQ